MRPVEKGPAPRSYTDYRDAANDLVQRLGRYCSYCEKNLANAPEVEHIQPKSSHPNLKLAWTNFLLACKNCNTIKSDKSVNVGRIAFPHIDNTFRGLQYEGSVIRVSSNLTTQEKRAIESLVRLVKLNRHPKNTNHDGQPTRADNRWQLRQEKWSIAKEMKREIDKFVRLQDFNHADKLR